MDPRRTIACTALLTVALLVGCAINPKPILDGDRRARMRADLERMFSGQEPLDGPLDLYGAMARAVKYNLEQRVVLMEQAVADRRLTQARLAMLPTLVASNGYYGRNNYRGSVSQSLVTGLQSLEASTSEEKQVSRTDLTLAWNLLDFGMSYVRAAQEANSALIARERRSKATQDIVAQVRGAYWRAVGAQRLVPAVDELSQSVQDALARSEQLEQEQLLDPVSALSYQRNLLERLKELSDLRSQLEIAQIDLAGLINLRPGAALELVAPEPEDMRLPEVDVPFSSLEKDALIARPELREEEYQRRISDLEVKRAMISVLPGLEISLGRNYDSNAFLTDNDWWNYSAVLSRNLVEIVTAPTRIGQAQTEVELADHRRMALSMAVLGQVHVAYRRLQAASEGAAFASKVRGVEERSHDIAAQMLEGGWESELEEIRAAAGRVVAELRFYLSYADAQAAYGQLLNSVGFQPILDESGTDVAALSDQIRRSMDHWRRRGEILRDYPDAEIAVNLTATAAPAR